MDVCAYVCVYIYILCVSYLLHKIDTATLSTLYLFVRSASGPEMVCCTSVLEGGDNTIASEDFWRCALAAALA